MAAPHRCKRLLFSFWHEVFCVNRHSSFGGILLNNYYVTRLSGETRILLHSDSVSREIDVCHISL